MTEKFKEDSNVLELAQAYSLDAVEYGEKSSMFLTWSDVSVRRTESILKDLHDEIDSANPSEDQIDTYAKIFGSYIGEVYRKNHGATWGIVELDGKAFPGLKCDGKAGLFWPWGKVQNRIINGPEDNVWDYYQALVKSNGRNKPSLLSRLFGGNSSLSN